MKKSNLRLINSIPNKYLNKNKKNFFLKKVDRIFSEILSNIENPSRTENVLNKDFKFNFHFNNLKKFKKFKTIALIGMGGSILGSEALKNFLEEKVKKKIYFFNDLDQKKILDIKKKVNLNKVLFIVISKSGNTVETLSNLFSLNIIKKKTNNLIVISEKKNNSLYNLTKQFQIFYIEHKPHIGGRYSVLSEVGIIPAYLMGINIFKLRSEIDGFIKKN